VQWVPHGYQKAKNPLCAPLSSASLRDLPSTILADKHFTAGSAISPALELFGEVQPGTLPHNSQRIIPSAVHLQHSANRLAYTSNGSPPLPEWFRALFRDLPEADRPGIIRGGTPGGS
jgi:hypothetical protein